MSQGIELMMIYIFKDEFPVINFNSLFMFMPVNIHIPYRNFMVKICPTDFCRKCISWKVGNLKMPVNASVVGINPAIVNGIRCKEYNSF